MAITTLAGANTGMKLTKDFLKVLAASAVAGHPYSTFYSAGLPAAAAAPTPGIGGAVLTSYTGQIPWENPVSGNSYLARLQAASSTACSLVLCDRLWHNSGIDLTSTLEQAFTGSAVIPARDANGAASGHGVFGALEFSAAGGAAAPVFTFKYTNQAATAGQTATTIIASANSPGLGKFQVFALAAGDLGVQKAESITLSTSQLSGTAHVVLFRVLARLELGLAAIPNAIDALTSGFVRLYDNTVPFLLVIPSVTGATVSGNLIVAQG